MNITNIRSRTHWDVYDDRTLTTVRVCCSLYVSDSYYSNSGEASNLPYHLRVGHDVMIKFLIRDANLSI